MVSQSTSRLKSAEGLNSLWANKSDGSYRSFPVRLTGVDNALWISTVSALIAVTSGH